MERKMKRISYYLIILTILGLFAAYSCKPKKQVVRTTTLPVESKVNSRLFTDILNAEVPFNSLSSKLNLTVTTGTRSMSSKASLKIINGRMLQLSIQPLFGVEIFRFHADRDSVIVLDRMNKRYVKEALTDIKKEYPVGFDYNTLQSLLTNKLFVAGKINTTPSDYESFAYSETSTNYYLKSKDLTSGIEYFFTINADDKITFTHLADADSNYSLQWNYSEFVVINNQTFPYHMKIAAGKGAKKIETELTFSDVVLNAPMELSINIPSGYTRVGLSDIIKIVSSDRS